MSSKSLRSFRLNLAQPVRGGSTAGAGVGVGIGVDIEELWDYLPHNGLDGKHLSAGGHGQHGCDKDLSRACHGEPLRRDIAAAPDHTGSRPQNFTCHLSRLNANQRAKVAAPFAADDEPPVVLRYPIACGTARQSKGHVPRNGYLQKPES